MCLWRMLQLASVMLILIKAIVSRTRDGNITSLLWSFKGTLVVLLGHQMVSLESGARKSVGQAVTQQLGPRLSSTR